MLSRTRGRKAFDKKTIQASFTGHLTGLPEDILALFQPGPPYRYLPPLKKKHRNRHSKGLTDCLSEFGEKCNLWKAETNHQEFLNKEYRYQVHLIETLLEKKMRNAKERYEQHRAKLERELLHFKPTSDPNVEGDPFKTLFVARLSYKVTEWKLRREFEEFGPVSRIRIVTDKISGTSRGYAFIEFEFTEDMKRAYRMGMNRNIEGRRVIVDVERGRTVSNWSPRRLGGGLGGESRLPKRKKTMSKSAPPFRGIHPPSKDPSISRQRS